jgi:hypothetical protein
MGLKPGKFSTVDLSDRTFRRGTCPDCLRPQSRHQACSWSILNIGRHGLNNMNGDINPTILSTYIFLSKVPFLYNFFHVLEQKDIICPLSLKFLPHNRELNPACQDKFVVFVGEGGAFSKKGI